MISIFTKHCVFCLYFRLSFSGRIGGAQEINYESPGCLTRYGTIQHEMYHALGFHHEQSRTDRDDFVTINWENIEEGR